MAKATLTLHRDLHDGVNDIKILKPPSASWLPPLSKASRFLEDG